jgi:hypothetical protein
MIDPAKSPFSAMYSEYEICGALELLDQGSSEGSDMVQACVAEGSSVEGSEKELGLDWMRLRGRGVIDWVLNTRVKSNVHDA